MANARPLLPHYHSWTVVGEAYSNRSGKRPKRYVKCRCVCGTERDVQLAALEKAASKSCGCDRITVDPDKFLHKTIGRITVLGYIRSHGVLSVYKCVCSCGKEMKLNYKTVKDNTDKNHKLEYSCGCANTDIRRYTLRSYYGMMDRCSNPKNDNYLRYGGRGIKVCGRWNGSPDVFFEDMGIRPKGLTLERSDNDGDYTPDNCRWATRMEQTHNRSVNKLSLPIARQIRLLGDEGLKVDAIREQLGLECSLSCVRAALDGDTWE